jgi:hypothetical protein
MKHQPTESELLEMGFEESAQIHELEYSIGRYFIVFTKPRGKFYIEPENGICSIPAYPTSKSDIETLIKLLTP